MVERERERERERHRCVGNLPPLFHLCRLNELPAVASRINSALSTIFATAKVNFQPFSGSLSEKGVSLRTTETGFSKRLL